MFVNVSVVMVVHIVIEILAVMLEAYMLALMEGRVITRHVNALLVIMEHIVILFWDAQLVVNLLV